MRLAVVDDHEMVRDGLVALLASQPGYDVVYVGDDVEEAASLFLDVVLLDIELGPTSPGVAVNVARFVAAGTPVLLISAYEDRADVLAGMRAGALGFVPKRVGVTALQEALECAARGEVHMSQELAALMASGSLVPDLSARELEALRLYASGLKIAAVGHRMGISPHTAKAYLDRVRDKYGQVGRTARTRTQLYAEASRDGLLLDV